LSPHILENFGVAKAIQSFCSKIEQSGKVPIHFRTNLYDERFKGNIEVILYRSACELIHNTIQHAQAQTILISLDLEGNILKFLYQDDGIGFDYQNVILNNKNGMGLHNLRSRVGSLNGTMNIDSLPGQGEVVTIEIPV
jgi:signal transduction histidine kinase